MPCHIAESVMTKHIVVTIKLLQVLGIPSHDSVQLIPCVESYMPSHAYSLSSNMYCTPSHMLNLLWLPVHVANGLIGGVCCPAMVGMCKY